MPGFNRLYIGANRMSVHGGGGVGLGPNLLTNPNGSYLSGGWTAEQITETSGQTDPLGGSTAELETDNAVSNAHRFFQSTATLNGKKHLVTVYYKPGTYPNGFTVSTFGATTTGVAVSNAGSPSTITGSPTNTTVTSVGGFFKLTFNFISDATTTFFTVNFGSGVNLSYVGSGQTSTFWGMALQTST